MKPRQKRFGGDFGRGFGVARVSKYVSGVGIASSLEAESVRMSQSPGSETTADVIETYRETVHALYKFVSWRAGGSRQLAEDITQETYLRATVQWRNGRRPDNAPAWLRTVARNLLLNHYRHKSAESLEASRIECVLETKPVDGPDAAALVYWGLARLGRRRGRLLEAFYIEGKSMRVIATDLGLSERAVEGRLRRAKSTQRSADTNHAGLWRNVMNEDHTPDSEFVNRLEWELKSTIRRRGFPNGMSSAMQLGRSHFGAALALVIVSMFIGGAGTHAVTRSIEGEAAALHIARGEALLDIARTRVEPFARALASAQSLVQRGAATGMELRQIETQHAQAESEAKIRELELAETVITGKQPNDALSASLAGGRDFVTERMAARRRPMQRRLELMIDQARRCQELNDAGVGTAGELKASQAEVVGPEEELVGLEKRIALRASFLAGELSATEVELQGMRLAAVTARKMAVHQVEVLVEQHERYTLLSERGFVSGSELRAVEAELRTVEARVELSDLELRILDQKLEDALKR